MRRGWVRTGLVIMLLTAMTGTAGAGLYEKGGANGLGARAMGMAGAYTALAADETAVWWNPAGLGEIDTLRFGTSLESLYDGRMRSLNLLGAMPLPSGAAVGFNWSHNYYDQSAEINADLLTVAGSIPLSRDQRLRLGAGIKFLFGNLQYPDQNYQGVGLDAGLRYKLALPNPEQALVLGLSIKDLDTRINWNHGLTEQIPQSVALGSALHIDQYTTAALDLEYVNSGQEEGRQTRILRLGLERWFQNVIGVRAGYLLDDAYVGTFSFGAGAKISGLELQYALLGQVSGLGVSHRLTVNYGLPEFPPKAAPRPRAKPTPYVPAAFQAELIALPEVFTPRGKGLANTVVFQLRLLLGDWAQVGSWHLQMEDSDGQVVREYRGKEYTDQFVWDGKNQRGKFATDGPYQARLKFFDERRGRLGEAVVSVLIKSPLPQIGLNLQPKKIVLFRNQKAQPVSIRFTNIADLPVVSWFVTVQNNRGETVKTFRGDGQLPYRLVWDDLRGEGQPLSAGKYTIQVDVSDDVGQTQSAQRTLPVVRIKPELKMQITPRLINLTDKKGAKATFTLDIKPRREVQSWKIELRQAQSKKLVRRLTGTGQPPSRAVWNCRNAAGRLVARGQYFHAQLVVTFNGGHEVAGPVLAVATDIGTEEAGRALALHLTMITFSPGSTTIPLGDFKRLKQASETVKKYAKRYRLQIKGYTDNREAKGKELEISWERARKVRDYLNSSAGIPNNKMEIVGYGSRLPLAPETTAAGRAKNRRVEVVLIIQK